MKICLLPGDGIGVEIVDAAVEVLDAAAKKYGFEIEYDKQLIGGYNDSALNDSYFKIGRAHV